MTQNLRRRQIGVKNLLDVCAADPAGGDFDEDFAIADFGYGDFFDADDTLFAVDTGAHGLGDRTQIPCRLQGCARPTHFAATSWSSGGGQPWLRKESSLINASRKLQSASAAVRLCLPSRISAGNCS